MRKSTVSLAIAALFMISACVVCVSPSPLNDIEAANGPNNTTGDWSAHTDPTWFANPVGNTYTITSAEQLADLANRVNGDDGYTTNSFNGKTIELKPSNGLKIIDLSDYYWVPIGAHDSSPFNGNVEGNGVLIKGMYIGTATAPADYDNTGLFGYSNGGVIKDIGIDETSAIYGTNYVGGIVGYVANYISGCYNTGTVSGANFVGGITGDASNISGCYNTGTVSGTNNVGGIAGNANYISGCYNTGTVSGANFVGGITGDASNISGCYNTGTVSGTDCVGGIVGVLVRALVSRCYNTGTVSGANYVGGIAGSNGMDSMVVNSYNTGTVSATDCVGGIVGISYNDIDFPGAVRYCYNTFMSGTTGSFMPIVGYGVPFDAGTCYWLIFSGSETGGALLIGNMTRQNASSNMSELDFDDTWTINDERASFDKTHIGGYAPELLCFAASDNSVVREDSMKSALYAIGLKTNAPGDIGSDDYDFDQEGEYKYTVGQKLNDIVPRETVPVGFTGGTFTWVDGGRELTEVGENLKAKMNLRSALYLDVEVSVTISVSPAPLTPPGPGDDGGDGGDGSGDGNGGNGSDGGDDTMLYVGIAAVAAIAVLGVVYFVFIRKP